MKIGMIVYSEKGHTLSVVEKLKEKLDTSGHEAQIERITISGEATPDKFKFIDKPDAGGFDAYVFASPVQAFSLNPVMKTYLEGLEQQADKPAAFLCTKQLPFHWTGGNRAIKTMQNISQEKGISILGSEIVIWKDKEEQKATNEQAAMQAAQKLAQLFLKI